MKQLTKNERTLVSVIVILLFVFMFNVLIIAPLRENLNKTNEDIERLWVLFRKYTGLEKEKSSITSAYKQIEPYLGFTGTEDEKMTLILSRIETEARKAGLTIIDMKPDTSKTKVKSSSSVFRVRLNAEAEMPKIFSFLYSLENTDIFLKVDRINLAVKNEETGIMKMETIILGISIV
ncbi:MAG: GspMb/PilO family protein [Candidatus Omnitrophota bacterium]